MILQFASINVGNDLQIFIWQCGKKNKLFFILLSSLFIITIIFYEIKVQSSSLPNIKTADEASYLLYYMFTH